MKLSTLMVISTVVTAVFGIAFVLLPEQIFALYGAVEPNPSLNYTGQLFGVSLVTIAILSWLARNVEASAARNAIVLAFLIGDGIGFIAAGTLTIPDLGFGAGATANLLLSGADVMDIC